MAERYDIHALLSEPTIIYKEAPVDTAIGKASYTKTSNVAIKIEPTKRGAGVIYHSLLATDYLFTKYQKQVERLMHQYIKYGNYGWELTDIDISLIGGKCDNVGSDPLDYAIAAPIALARAISEAGTKFLEPVVAYTLSIPSVYYSEVIGRLMGMRKGLPSLQGTLVISESSFVTGFSAVKSRLIMFSASCSSSVAFVIP